MLKEGNFNLRKWISNCAEIVGKINPFEGQVFGEKIVYFDKFLKVLRILRNFEIDELFFDFKNGVSESMISTKREFLKILSFVYDPLGVVSLTIKTLKMLFQKICMMKINRDDVLAEIIIAEWQNILENVNVINSSKLQRHYLKMFYLKYVEIVELHGFSDGSLKAYAAVIYITFKLKYGSYSFSFVASKTKINPIERENLKIPKLKLMACVLLNQLMFSVYSLLEFNG